MMMSLVWVVVLTSAAGLQVPSSRALKTTELKLQSTVAPAGVEVVRTTTVPEHATALRKRPPPVLELPGDSLEERPAQRLIVAGTAALALGTAAHAATQVGPLTAAASATAALVAADFMTGIFHWATDNYGRLETPLVGPACAAFQGHHRAPWTITYRSTCNNVYKIAKIVAPLIALSGLAPPVLSLFLTVALFCQVLSQEFHKFSHMTPSEQPAYVRFAQKYGLAVSTAEHGRHHTAPFDGHYCIFTGMLNPILDETRFFRRLEAAVYRRFGVEPNCWKEGDKGPLVKAQALDL